MINLKPFRQSADFCGPASLVILLGYYNFHMSEKELGNLSNTTREFGTEPESLTSTLRKLGFDAESKQHGTWEGLKKLIDEDIPVIVNWWSDYGAPADGHYSVVHKMTDRTISLMDPEIGATRRIPKAKFMKQWYDFYYNGSRNDKWYLYIKKDPSRYTLTGQ